MEKNFLIYTTPKSKEFSQTIADHLGVDLGVIYSERFSDGEVYVRFDQTIREKTIFIISRINLPYENVFEYFLTIDAAKRSSAKEVVCVIPYLPHSRQERRDGERTSVASRMMADIIQLAGADRVITLEMHTNAIEGFYKVPVDHLQTTSIFAAHINSLQLPDICLCSPDFGGLKRIKQYKKHIESELAVINKERLRPNQVSHMEIIGEVSGKNVIIIDDMIDTAGTLCKASEIIMEHGAKSVRAYCTHGLLTGNAIERIEASPLESVCITDTIDRQFTSSKIKVASSRILFARAIENILCNRSISQLNNELLG
ncbi:MAG TPA: ribose-phosphate diphosphokinase [Cytophagales bacterium]|nr:ribose-phosphate diphosphokinase [Cytophagales bacterium]